MNKIEINLLMDSDIPDFKNINDSYISTKVGKRMGIWPHSQERKRKSIKNIEFGH